MACCLFGAISLSEQMLYYCQLDPTNLRIQTFLLKKIYLKLLSGNCQSFYALEQLFWQIWRIAPCLVAHWSLRKPPYHEVSVFCQGFGEMGTDDPYHWTYGDIGNFPGVTYVILPFVNLKFVGTWAPTAKIIGDISDFNVLNVPKTQTLHNPGVCMEHFKLFLIDIIQ